MKYYQSKTTRESINHRLYIGLNNRPVIDYQPIQNVQRGKERFYSSTEQTQEVYK